MVRQLRALIRHPHDLVLLPAIGIFIARLPQRIERAQSLPHLLRELRNSRTPRASQARIVRLRGWWMWKRFGAMNTCYGRALTLYRFLDAPDEAIELHMGIETREGSERLHGHAWVTVSGSIVEGPDEVLQGRVREVALTK